MKNEKERTVTIYEQLSQDGGFLRSITNEVPNQSEPYPHAEFLARFEKSVEARNSYVQQQLKARADAVDSVRC